MYVSMCWLVQGVGIQQRVIADDTQDVGQRRWTSGGQGEGWPWDSSTEVSRYRRWGRYEATLLSQSVCVYITAVGHHAV